MWTIHDNSYGFVINFLYLPCLLFVAITIGLNVSRVTVDEDVEMTELCASVVGEFDREIVVSGVYQDRRAIGEGSIVPPIIYIIT